MGGGEGVGGRMGGRDLSDGGRSFSERGSDRGPRFGGREGGRFAGDRDRDDRNFHFRHGRHGHFVGGVWVWDYGLYAYNDCGWLRHQAIISGSPYWWHRYRACLGY
jgi:hypothetical protein